MECYPIPNEMTDTVNNFFCPINEDYSVVK